MTPCFSALCLSCPLSVAQYRLPLSCQPPFFKRSVFGSLLLTGFFQAKCRILCLTDGCDTVKKRVPWQVAKGLQEKDIIVDAVLIGPASEDSNLPAIAKATNGYVFSPPTLKVRPNPAFPGAALLGISVYQLTFLQDALNLNELETFLCLAERPVLSPPKPITSYMSYNPLLSTKADRCDDGHLPQRKMPEEMKNPVVPLATSLQKPAQGKSTTTSRTREILRQMKQLVDAPHPNIDIFPCEEDIGFWRGVLEGTFDLQPLRVLTQETPGWNSPPVIEFQGAHPCFVGPEETPYEGGAWEIYVKFPETFPVASPEVRFVTPIKHCNVNQYGTVNPTSPQKPHLGQGFVWLYSHEPFRKSLSFYIYKKLDF